LPEPGGPSSTVVIRRPDPDELTRRWHEIAPILSAACERSRCYEPVDVLMLVLAADMLLWIIEINDELVAVVVCKAQQYPRRKVLEMKFAAGTRMREWLSPATRHFEALGRELNCDAISSTGRRGWAKACDAAEVDSVCVRDLRD